MDENTKLYYDVIKEQFNMAKSRLNEEQLQTLAENLSDLINDTGMEELEDEEEEE